MTSNDFDPAAHSIACRDQWPDQIYAVGGQRFALRARCTTCKCYTIPVTVQCARGEGGPSSADASDDTTPTCAIKAPGKYPCPVCGQDDQYIMVWIAARARHHARALNALREQGYVSDAYGALRNPWPQELPDPAMRPMIVAGANDEGGGSIADVSALLVRIGDARKVAVPDDYHGRPGSGPMLDDTRDLASCERCTLGW
jgi:hypothetical protein